MKKRMFLSMVILIILTITAFAGGQPSDDSTVEPIVLRLAEIYPADHPTTL